MLIKNCTFSNQMGFKLMMEHELIYEGKAKKFFLMMMQVK